MITGAQNKKSEMTWRLHWAICMYFEALNLIPSLVLLQHPQD